MLDTFGKDAESLTNIVKGFCKILEPYPMGDIATSFLQWAKSQSKMPAPADIVKLCDELAQEKAAPRAAPTLADVRWIQVIKNIDTDEEIARKYHGQHLSPLQRDRDFGARTYVRMERES